MKQKVIGCLLLVMILSSLYNDLFAEAILESDTDTSDYFSTVFKTENKGANVPELTIRTSEIIDTYLIASALYLNFESQTLLPDTENTPIYTNAKTYFLPYVNHDFVTLCGQFIYGDDINGDAIGVILSYYDLEKSKDLSQSSRLEGINEIYRQDIFEKDEEIIKFIDALEAFYVDTTAHEFFEENQVLLNSVDEYTVMKYKTGNSIKLISEMESYIDTDNDNEYEVILSIFRPSMASFFTYAKKDTIKVISFQSPNGFDRNPYNFDYNAMLETMIHEFLHVQLNGIVKDITVQMKSNKVVFPEHLIDSPMYRNMPINRQLDEYIVRAVECRIYTKIYGELYTFMNVMEKEIHYGGFNKLLDLYELFSKYETRRDEYKTIDAFLPEVIQHLTLSK